MADLLDPKKDYSDYYTYYPKVRITAWITYIILNILIIPATIRVVQMIFF